MNKRTTLPDAQRAELEAPKILQALQSYAGRMAATDDPKEHQKAAAQLQKNLQTLRK